MDGASVIKALQHKEGSKVYVFIDPSNVDKFSDALSQQLPLDQSQSDEDELVCLERIKLYDIASDKFPAHQALFTRLKSLEWTKSNLTQLPPSMKECRKIIKLNLSQNCLESMPEELPSLPVLRDLDASHNSLTCIQPQVLHLLQLENLNLENNKLRTLPDDLSSLCGLITLNLKNNQLKSLPRGLWDCSHLKTLDLGNDVDNEGVTSARHNSLQDIPPNVCQLKQLENLSLAGNGLKQLPLELWMCDNLIDIDLSYNKLGVLPDAVSHLAKLERLSIRGNENIHVSSSLWTCRSLLDLDLSYTSLRNLSADIGNLSRLQRLAVAGNWLSELPTELWDCKSLKFLCLDRNQIEKIPLCISNLEQLHHLSVRQNGLQKLPETIGNCKELIKLDIDQNHIKELPLSLHQLGNLEILSARKNKLKEVPIGLGNCRKLSQVYLASNNLCALPESIGQLDRLHTLNVCRNELVALPETMECHPQFKTLDLDYNKLQSFNSKLFNRPSELQMLSVVKNELKLLPSLIQNCRKLQYINLNGNKLSALPDSIGDLIDLHTFCVKWNQLKSLPSTLGNCMNLKKLELDGNKLTQLPSTMGQLGYLNTLSVRDNQLAELPSTLGQCTTLEELDLYHNQLQEFPESIGDLCNLRTLNAQKNFLSELPSTFGGCSKLEYILLDENQLLEIPSTIKPLCQLKTLSVRKNKLNFIHENIGECIEITKLHLNTNHLEMLPSTIGQLKKMRELGASFNKLTSLPTDLIKCKRLKELQIEGNNLKIPFAVLNGGKKAIMRYLEEARQTGLVASNRRNVMVVGETGAGKTSFVKTLLAGESFLTDKKDRTHVLTKYVWRQPSLKEPMPMLDLQPQFREPRSMLEIQINDFGGHECYNITTVIFWNESSLFVVLFNLEEYSEDTHKKLVGQWVNYLSDGIPGAIILLIGSHSDKLRQSDIDSRLELVTRLAADNEHMKMKQLKDKLERIEQGIENQNQTRKSIDLQKSKIKQQLKQRPCLPVPAFAVSSATCIGVEAAGKEILKILQNEEYFPTKEIPLTWHDFRDAIKDAKGHENAPWITWEQTNELASQVNLKGEQITDAMRYLWLSGDVVWYEDADVFKNIVFHQPNQLIEIFKEIISHDLEKKITLENPHLSRNPLFKGSTDIRLEQMKEDILKNGRITKDLLKCIWGKFLPDDSQEKLKHFNILVEIMVRFELAYHLPRRPSVINMNECEELRIPWFLVGERPKLPWKNENPENKKQITIKIQFLWQCPQLLLPTLCVRIQKYIAESIEWKKGIYAIMHSRDSIELLIALVTEGNLDALVFTVRGDKLNEMWKAAISIQRDVDGVMERWPGVVFERAILAPCCVRNGEPKPQMYPDDRLYQAYHLPKVICKRCGLEMKAIEVYPPNQVLENWNAQYREGHVLFLRYSRLVNEFGAKALLKVLEKYIQHKHNNSFIEWLQVNESANRKELRGFLKWQKRQLYPESGNLNVSSLDITTLKTVFTKLLPEFPEPKNSWEKELSPDDFSQGADILRLGQLRNGPHLAHNPRSEMSQQDFETKWNEARTILLRLDPECEQGFFALQLGQVLG